MAKDLFNRYIWLVDTIYQSGKITLEEINARWLRCEMSEGVEIPLRTFHNHRRAIEEMFDINIECNKRGGYYYYIENVDDIEKGGTRNWLLNTFAVNNLMTESHKLRDRILFEEIPSGRQFLTTIIEAMRDGQAVEMTYQSYWREKPSTFEVEPYCVKVFKQRWYVVAHSPFYDKIMIYALDRISNLHATHTKFEYPKDFDPKAYFNFSFGIIVDETCRVENVEIKVFGNKCKYLRALPLHHSQKEISITDCYSIFQYQLCPTYDFCQELLSHGSEMEVLSPQKLREQIGKISSELVNFYL